MKENADATKASLERSECDYENPVWRFPERRENGRNIQKMDLIDWLTDFLDNKALFISKAKN